jgi:2-hydroxy-3-keto-5-methylthiopentenyl-1-phosphate phosphatase
MPPESEPQKRLLPPQEHTWDGKFKPYTEGLRPPEPVSPDISDIELRVMANVVYQTLKKRDKLFKEALFSSNGQREQALLIEEQYQNQITGLLAKIDNARSEVDSCCEVQGAIRDKYIRADRDQFLSHPDKPVGEYTQDEVDEWVLRRLEEFRGLKIGEDVDKTLTAHADYLDLLPGSIQAENYMAHEDHGRRTFPLAFVRYWQEAMQVLSHNFYVIGSRVQFRPGVEEFYERTLHSNIPHSLISANFRPFINGVMSHIPYPHILSSYAIEPDDIRATDKCTIVRQEIMKDPLSAFAYAGDGGSDLPALEEPAAQITAFYFALEGEKFHHALREAQLPHYTYRTFHDVTATLARLGVLA